MFLQKKNLKKIGEIQSHRSLDIVLQFIIRLSEKGKLIQITKLRLNNIVAVVAHQRQTVDLA